MHVECDLRQVKCENIIFRVRPLRTCLHATILILFIRLMVELKSTVINESLLLLVRRVCGGFDQAANNHVSFGIITATINP